LGNIKTAIWLELQFGLGSAMQKISPIETVVAKAKETEMQNKIESVSIPCTACGGCGTIPLNGIYLATYQFVCHHGETTASDLMLSDRDLSRSNACNRLKVLHNIGVLSMRRQGNRCIYSKAEQ